MKHQVHFFVRYYVSAIVDGKTTRAQRSYRLRGHGRPAADRGRCNGGIYSLDLYIIGADRVLAQCVRDGGTEEAPRECQQRRRSFTEARRGCGGYKS